jgi:DNA-binding transcriptional ArsR family regulator
MFGWRVFWLFVCDVVKIGIIIANKVIEIPIAAIDMPSIITVVLFDANKNFCHL